MRRSLSLLVLVLLIAACQNIDGPCPEISSITPDAAGSLEAVEIRGRDFALGYRDIWSDEAQGTTPDVFLDVSLRDSIPPEFEAMFTEDELASMEAMDMTLQAEQVAFESAELLNVTLPELTWDDIVSGASMMGSDIPELPAFITEFPLVSQVRVVNPSGCEGTWEGDFSFVLVIDQGGE
jgi:hypothetical protein